MKVYIHRAKDWYGLYLNDVDINNLEEYAEVVNEKDRMTPFSEQELIERIGNAEVIISLNGKGVADFTPRVIEKIKETVKVICIAHWWKIHNDFVPMCRSAGIQVIEGSNLNTIAVAEWTLAAILSGVRRIGAFDKSMKAMDEWCEHRRNAGMLYESTLGLVGLGRIGRYIAHYARLLGANIIAYDAMSAEHIEALGIMPVTLEELFRKADIISLHLPVTPLTTGLIKARHFAEIKEGALFVNSARAVLYNEEELITELAKGRFTAFLDVFEEEPLSVDSPLRRMDNVVLTPHIAGDNNKMFKLAGSDSINTIISFIKTGKLVDKQYKI